VNERWYPAIVIAALFGAMIFALHADLSSPSFPTAQTERTQQTEQKGASAAYQGTDTVFSGITLVDLATLALAVSTFGLWIVTRRSVRIAERTLTELERAYVFPSHKQIIGSNTIPLSIQYRMRNIGRTPAIIKEFRVCFYNNETLPAGEPNYSAGELQKFNWAIAGNDSGDTKIFTSPFTGRQLFCAEIRFLDIFGIGQYSRAASEWQPEGFGDEGETREAGGEPYNSWSQAGAHDTRS